MRALRAAARADAAGDSRGRGAQTEPAARGNLGAGARDRPAAEHQSRNQLQSVAQRGRLVSQLARAPRRRGNAPAGMREPCPRVLYAPDALHLGLYGERGLA